MQEEYLYDDKALEKYRKTHTGSFTLQRYKGLGEMDAQQLWETTLDPKTRILKRVEIEDARMASDVTEVLMGTDVPPRKAFIYQHAKDIGSLSVVMKGKVDAILLTGGIAYGKDITDAIASYTEWIAPVVVIPGEREMIALAQGALRVLNGEEEAKEYEAW